MRVMKRLDWLVWCCCVAGLLALLFWPERVEWATDALMRKVW